jgi:ATP-binding protein involved in chromosome partitioning
MEFETQLKEQLPWLKEVSVHMAAEKSAEEVKAELGLPGDSNKAASGGEKDAFPGLKYVRNVLAVSSCKGGVGKSTVSVNLALSLARHHGLKVGVFDCDLYGPSLPTLIELGPDHTGVVQRPDKLLEPVAKGGVKWMSFGWLKDSTLQHTASIMRGPMLANLMHQLIIQTHWSDLDVLILDLPPGTGDVQLTMIQKLKEQLVGTVTVTTPSLLSHVDVVKGVEMFERLDVPLLGVVENMAYFTCGNCEEKHDIFGSGAGKQHLAKLLEGSQTKHVLEVPMSEKINRAAEIGYPYMVSDDAELLPVQEAYKTFTKPLADVLL